MVTGLVTFSPEADVFDSVKMLLKRQITGGPVVDQEGRYLGVFSEKRCLTVLTRVIRMAGEDDPRVIHRPVARDFMATKLVRLSPNTDVFEAIAHLLKNHISGAPVVDDAGRFMGVFSEKTSMSVLVQAAYEQLPSTRVGAFMNTDFGRTIPESTDLLDCADIFLKTPYRRLPVLDNEQLVGQISRRDVLTSQCRLVCELPDRYRCLRDETEDHPQASGGISEKATVGEFLDSDAKTIHEELDLLAIAQLFLHTPYRRLPVIKDGKLVGQISRRDLLAATHQLMAHVPQREKALLYLSALHERDEAPI
jgi:CBS domain-containing protein